MPLVLHAILLLEVARGSGLELLRLRKRGFNGSIWPARPLGAKLGVKVHVSAVWMCNSGCCLASTPGSNLNASIVPTVARSQPGVSILNISVHPLSPGNHYRLNGSQAGHATSGRLLESGMILSTTKNKECAVVSLKHSFEHWRFLYIVSITLLMLTDEIGCTSSSCFKAVLKLGVWLLSFLRAPDIASGFVHDSKHLSHALLILDHQRCERQQTKILDYLQLHT